MKHFGFSFVISGLVSALLMLPAVSASAEDWKGSPSAREFTVGFMTGLGVVEPKYGFALLGNAAKKIANEGFIPDFNDQVFIEAELGTIFADGQRPFFYSLHLRWDFQQNDQWIFFAMGGLAGQITGAHFGDRAMVFPRIGGGLLYYLNQNFSLRAEVSHEVTGVGLSFEF